MRIGGILGAVTVSALVFAACGGDDASTTTSLAPIVSFEEPATTTTVATTTTTLPPDTLPPTTTTSTTTTTTTTTTVPKAAQLVLREDGLGDALFGTEPNDVVGYVTAILGPPSSDSGWTGPFGQFGICPGDEVRGVTWTDLTLLFSNRSTVASGRRHFFSWSYGAAPGNPTVPDGMRTASGIGIGSTVAQLKAAHPRVTLHPPDVFAASFVISPTLSGFLTGTSDTDRITSFTGGIGCGE